MDEDRDDIEDAEDERRCFSSKEEDGYERVEDVLAVDLEVAEEDDDGEERLVLGMRKGGEEKHGEGSRREGSE